MAENSVEDTDQKLARFKEPVMAIAAGVGAALVVVTLPHVYLESAIGATGLSEILPAAAPPLGNTARGLIAVMAGLVSASAIYFFLNRKGSSDMGVALREQINAASPIELDLEEEASAKKGRFSLPKFDAKSLTKFLKKPKKNKARVMDLADLPQLRKVDSEADAPERPPIFAEAEAPSPLPEAIQPFEEAEPAEPVLADIPFNPTETVAETPQAVTEETAVEQPVAAPAEAAQPPAEDLSDLNIAELTDRLEAGLRRLKQLEAGTFAATPAPAETVMTSSQMTSTQPTVETQPAAGPISEAPVMASPPLSEVEKSPQDMAAVRQADMDAALKAALGTLEKMTAQR
ncbi:MAG: hypothetical protein Pars92KO_25400 [Parasphingorhabdus sp.]